MYAKYIGSLNSIFENMEKAFAYVGVYARETQDSPSNFKYW